MRCKVTLERPYGGSIRDAQTLIVALVVFKKCCVECVWRIAAPMMDLRSDLVAVCSICV